jgi:hypothetical protein
VPPGADAAALAAAKHLATVDALLRLRGGQAREDARVRAIAEAARSLPGEIEVDAFARRLASLVRQGTGAAGWRSRWGRTRRGGGGCSAWTTPARRPARADGFGEGESGWRWR